MTRLAVSSENVTVRSANEKQRVDQSFPEEDKKVEMNVEEEEGEEEEDDDLYIAETTR